MIEGAASKAAITAKKELLSGFDKFLLVVIGILVIAYFGLMTCANWAVESEELMDAYIFEQGQELGYNWTEQNMTVFENMVDTGFLSSAPMHEVMCSNGVQEGCDYMSSVDTAKSLYGLTFGQMLLATLFFGMLMVSFAIGVILLLWVGASLLYG